MALKTGKLTSDPVRKDWEHRCADLDESADVLTGYAWSPTFIFPNKGGMFTSYAWVYETPQIASLAWERTVSAPALCLASLLNLSIPEEVSRIAKITTSRFAAPLATGKSVAFRMKITWNVGKNRRGLTWFDVIGIARERAQSWIAVVTYPRGALLTVRERTLLGRDLKTRLKSALHPKIA